MKLAIRVPEVMGSV